MRFKTLDEAEEWGHQHDGCIRCAVDYDAADGGPDLWLCPDCVAVAGRVRVRVDGATPPCWFPADAALAFLNQVVFPIDGLVDTSICLCGAYMAEDDYACKKCRSELFS